MNNPQAELLKAEARRQCEEQAQQQSKRQAIELARCRKRDAFTSAVSTAVSLDSLLEAEKDAWGMPAHTQVNIPDCPLPNSLSRTVQVGSGRAVVATSGKAFAAKVRWEPWEQVYEYSVVENKQKRVFACPLLDAKSLQDLLQERELCNAPNAWDLSIALRYFSLNRLELATKYAQAALRDVDIKRLMSQKTTQSVEKDTYCVANALGLIQQDAYHILFEAYCKMAHSKRAALDHELYVSACVNMRKWLVLREWSAGALLEIHETIELLRLFSGPRHLREEASLSASSEGCVMQKLHVEVLERSLSCNSAATDSSRIESLQKLYYESKELTKFIDLSVTETGVAKTS